MGEKGTMTSGELSALRDAGDVGVAVGTSTGGAAGSVTTVLADGATTVISTGASLAEKVADKAVDLSGDELARRLRPDGSADAPSSTEER